MRIALTHNLRISDAVEQSAFTSSETIAALSESMSFLGHSVTLIEVSGPVEQVISRLRGCHPELVFNLAEGRSGTWRQAFYPALFEELHLPYTASPPHALAIALDKHLTKLLLHDRGIATPLGQFVRSVAELNKSKLVYPVIVKPNFEASSRGINARSVARAEGEARARVEEVLQTYPDGVVVEEYISGHDITVSYLEAVHNEHNGVLEPAEILFEGNGETGGPDLMDYDLKTKPGQTSHSATLRLPAAIPEHIRRKAREWTRFAVESIGCRDVARVDFRLGNDGELYLLEVNSLPSLDPGASLPQAAELAGLPPKVGFVDAIITSAAKRYQLSLKVPAEREEAV